MVKNSTLRECDNQHDRVWLLLWPFLKKAPTVTYLSREISHQSAWNNRHAGAYLGGVLWVF